MSLGSLASGGKGVAPKGAAPSFYLRRTRRSRQATSLTCEPAKPAYFSPGLLYPSTSHQRAKCDRARSTSGPTGASAGTASPAAASIVAATDRASAPRS